jgi:hypothetical protein
MEKHSHIPVRLTRSNNKQSLQRAVLALLSSHLLVGTAFAQWNAMRQGTEVVVTYDNRQYAAFHTESGYFRLVSDAASGWGTSVLVMPSYWSRNYLYQGAFTNTSWFISGANMVLRYSGNVGVLGASGHIVIHPPTGTSVTADVSVQVTGSVALDSRPGEAFKPVFLSSMNVAPNQWDSRTAWNGKTTQDIPVEGLIFGPNTFSNRITLDGGSNSWKVNAPTIDIRFDQVLSSMGWVTRSTNPNDDNVGLWLGSDKVLPYYSFKIVSRKANMSQ